MFAHIADKIKESDGLKPIIIVDQFSGITIGQVMPEAAEGGPLAYVENGDEIEIDLGRRSIDLLVGREEMERRLSVPPRLPAAPRGWLSIYRATVGPLARGAVVGDAMQPKSASIVPS